MKRASDILNSNGSSHPKNDKVEETNLTIDDMPNEILDAVLRNVSPSDLVNCRHVNRKWNDVSSRVMHKRADIKIVFSYLGNELTQCIQHRPSQTLLKDFWPLVNEVSELTFSDLVECLKLSKNVPLANFRFKDVIRDDDIESFLSIWGRNITALGVKIEKDADVKLLRVFLQKTPMLKNLSINFGSIDFYYEQSK
ncbi:hypothetical protein HA402_007904 [Bradysia odoriphaga]|nr:hypothetical protein HA402_007904 [Bradysia odoriphaga]